MASPYANLLESTQAGDRTIKFYNIAKLGPAYNKLPFSIRVLLESAVRNCDNFQVSRKFTFFKTEDKSFFIFADFGE